MTKININKGFAALYNEDKMPRKTKKKLLGKLITPNRINKKIKTLVIKLDGEIIDPFCPKCGCDHSIPHHHPTTYPDMWIDFYCLRCGYQVGEVDNSRFHHVLEAHNV